MSTRKQHRNPWLQESQTGQPLFMSASGTDRDELPRFYESITTNASVTAGDEKAVSERNVEMEYTWAPSQKHLEVLAARNIPESYISEQTFSFQAHYEGRTHTNWNGQFVKWVWKSWTQFGGQKRFNESVTLEDEIGENAAATFRNNSGRNISEVADAGDQNLLLQRLSGELIG